MLATSHGICHSGTAPLAIEISLERPFDSHYSDPTCDCDQSDFYITLCEVGCGNTAKYYDQVRRLIRLAVGEAGEHMARWSSLSIDFCTPVFE